MFVIILNIGNVEKKNVIPNINTNNLLKINKCVWENKIWLTIYGW